MPSSTSSSDLRQTASDRPGVAQPVPSREIPDQPWLWVALGAAVLCVGLLTGWELHWRHFGAEPSMRNSDGLWAIQRRRIDAGEGNATVLLGDSRMFYGLELSVWQQLDGKRPIQLAFEGTSPLRFMEDLAEDEHFTGRLLVNVAPVMYFEAFARHNGAIGYYHRESPSQRIGQWLSMRFIEPFFAFDDPDFALATVLERQPWPERPGKQWPLDVRKISRIEADRNGYMWNKVFEDAGYASLIRSIWTQRFAMWRRDPPPDKLRDLAAEQIRRTSAAVAKLRTRGVKVIFVRLPSSGPFLALENDMLPRLKSWDALLEATGAPGINFEDYEELRGFELPEWSHLKRTDAETLTASLYRIIKRDFWGKDDSR